MAVASVSCGSDSTAEQKAPHNLCALLAICFGLGAICFVLFSPFPAAAGLILGCCGLAHNKKFGSGKKGLALTGIISGSLILAAWITVLLVQYTLSIGTDF